MDTTIDPQISPTHGHYGDHNQNPPLLTSIHPLWDEKDKKDSMASGNTSTRTKVTHLKPRSIIGCVTQFFVEAATRVINLPGYSQEYYDEMEFQETSHEPEIKGRSLFIFDSENTFRKRMCWLLNQKWAELFMLLLTIVNLVFDMIKISSPAGNDTKFGSHWTDYGLMAIFCVYTLVIVIKSIACGFALYPKESQEAYSVPGTNDDAGHDMSMGQVWDIFKSKYYRIRRPHYYKEKVGLPFLRHTFNLIDLIAVAGYWIDVVLMLTGVGGAQNIYIFKAMAVMSTFRLLKITLGTSIILHSLKRSAPLLANVALFIAFFFIIFSIIGVQSFQGSFSRQCVSRDPSQNITLDQSCGGYLNNITLEKVSYITKSGETSSTKPKGYICPIDFICKDTGYNLHGTISFDTIYSAMVPVYVLMAGQTWTDLMYRMMDAEYKWSSLYFVFVMVVMNFWILNLFVAVINEMFAKIREESEQSSAFAPHYAEDEEKTPCEHKVSSQKQAWLDLCELFWVIVVIADIVIQCLPQYASPQARLDHIETLEFIFSVVFIIDIFTRFLIYHPEYPKFLKSKKNMVDLFLVIATLTIEAPVIRQSNVYKYLTIFRVLRIYRPIIYYERLRSLIERVIGSWAGLLNLILFIGLFLAMVSVMAGFLFREILLPLVLKGDGPVMTFQDFYLSYLGVYQLFSGENWTDVLYSAMGAEVPWHQVVFAAVFLIAFYSVANFILVNMLIAIIMENFEEKSDDAKRAQQIDNIVAKSRLSPEDQEKVRVYLERFLKPHPRSIGEQEYDDIREKIRSAGGERDLERIMDHLKRSFSAYPKSIDKQKIREIAANSDFTEEEQKIIQEYLEKHFYETLRDQEIHRISVRQLLVGDTPPKETETNLEQETTTGGELSSDHSPSSQRNTAFTDKSLLIFSRKNKFRRFLQSFVEPHREIRDGDPPKNKVLRRSFNAFITLAILASVIVAAITTPVWSLEQSKLEPADRSPVIHITDIAFPVIFTLEFVLRVIADGLLFTPDAYLRSIWNVLDMLVLASMYVPLFANTSNSRGVSRFFRSLKSLRALRLVNRSSYIKKTFHAVLVAGFPQLLCAVMLSLALLVPFAIYGMNLFKGLLFSCSDNGNTINTLYDCRVEFTNNNGVLMPRVWSNPTVYSFDNFFASLLILFEIVSQEGWIGVMSSARDIVGLGMQPNTDASRYNGIFFVLFNLAGGYFVVSLFVATIIENYTKRIGTASMTAPQKAWMDMKKLLRSTKMSKSTLPEDSQDKFCYEIASRKRSLFPRLLTFVTVLLAIVLMSDHVNSGDWEGTKNWIYLPLLLFFIAEIFIKLKGLGWRLFMMSRWNVYNSSMSIAALITTIIRLCGLSPQPLIQVQKLFLVAVLVRLVLQNDKLNQLFTIMVASFKSIASLFSVWLIVFAVYAVMFMEVFGLTAYGPNGGNNVNFRGFGITMLMMARMSTGEGWNDLMHDFALNPPNCVNHRENYLTSDCGSTPWAYSLFISFNVVSMYIFTNMFIVVVMHNFSYVYLISSDLPSIDRTKLRSFKETWALFDTNRTGYIQEEDIVNFLMELRGTFDMRIYEESQKLWNLAKILEGESDKDSAILGAYYYKIAGGDDKEKIKRKIWIFNAVYSEVIMSMEPLKKPATDSEKGRTRRTISFNRMLDIVVRNRLLKDDQYFSIAEVLQHKKTMDQVRVHTDVVNSRRALHNFILRIKFLKYYKKVKEIRANAAESNFAGGIDSNQRNRETGELIEIEELRETWRNRLLLPIKSSIVDKITKRPKKTTDMGMDKDWDEDEDEDRIDFKDILKTISEMEKHGGFKYTSSANSGIENLTIWDALVQRRWDTLVQRHSPILLSPILALSNLGIMLPVTTVNNAKELLGQGESVRSVFQRQRVGILGYEIVADQHSRTAGVSTSEPQQQQEARERERMLGQQRKAIAQVGKLTMLSREPIWIESGPDQLSSQRELITGFI